MKWYKVGDKTPPFKKIVLGAILPNQIELVKLDRIDETGPVFVRGSIDIGSIFSISSKVNIEYWAEITMPELEEPSK